MRYISHSPAQIEEMLEVQGLKRLEELFEDIPSDVMVKEELRLPEALDEIRLVEELTALGTRNTAGEYVSFLGAGAYDHYVPSAVKALVGRSEFYTAYTPYQAERSQGTLAAIFEYQTMIANLTGMDAVNASVYDGASSLAEAVLMACDIKGKSSVVISGALHPEYVETVKTYSDAVGIDIEEIPYTSKYATDWDVAEGLLNEECSALVVGMPNFFGTLEDVDRAKAVAEKTGALLIVVANPISLGLLRAPGDYGADIVVGEGQPLGNPLNFGGPYLGFMGTKKRYVRRMPGRIVGETKDARGKRAFVLTLQAREQHIRREKATSNLCSNQALNALAATIYMAILGRDGLREVAYHSHAKARYFIDRAREMSGIEVLNGNIFNEMVVEVEDPEFWVGIGDKGQVALAGGQNLKLLPGISLERFFPEEKNRLLVAFTERRSRQEIDTLLEALEVRS